MSLRERLGWTEDPLFVVDGTAYMFRCFFTGRTMQRSDGFPTNILVGLARLLLRLLREEKPRYLLFVRDGHGPTFRNSIYDKYKANRDTTPEDLVRQIAPVCELVRGLGLAQEETKGFEADDCLATLAARFSPTRPVVLVSGDKDLRQCLGERVVLWNLGAKEETILTEAQFVEENKIRPEQWADVQALTGDTADNIPGVPGIGPKTALKIFATCSSLEDIRDNLAKLSPKIVQKLRPHLEEMFRWRKLTRLSTEYPKSWSLDELAVRPPDAAFLQQFAAEYELLALGRDIATWLGTSAQPHPAPRPTVSYASHTVKDVAELPACEGRALAVLKEPSGNIAFALREQGQDGQEGTVAHYVYEGERTAFWAWAARSSSLVLPSVKPLYGDAACMAPLQAAGTEILDLGLACYLLRPEDSDFDWPHLEQYWAQALQDGTLGPAGLALVLAESVLKRLEENGVLTLYRQLELPLTGVLYAMEQAGIAIDRTAFRAFLEEVAKMLQELSETIYTLAGTAFNIRSSQQLAEVLASLHVSLPGRTKGGQISTSQQTLEKLLGEHPIVAEILHFRKLEKLRSTYLEPLPKLVDAQGRLHTTFDQKGTATGRLSSKDPNLQNIPVRGDLGRRMRSCFVAGQGKCLISADYSQIELRMLAHMSQDPVLLAAFREGADIHAETAALIYGIPLKEVTKDQRRAAKTINFGLIYGMGAQKLAQELAISLQEAKAFIENYFAKLTTLKAFYETVVETAKKQGGVTTIGGRHRNLPDLLSANGHLSAQAGRQAINTIIQGSAADIIKMAMLAVAKDDTLRDLSATLLLQVHDELVLEAPLEHGQAVGERVAALMEAQGTILTVPLVADWGLGHSWADAH